MAAEKKREQTLGGKQKGRKSPTGSPGPLLLSFRLWAWAGQALWIFGAEASPGPAGENHLSVTPPPPSLDGCIFPSLLLFTWVFKLAFGDTCEALGLGPRCCLLFLLLGLVPDISFCPSFTLRGVGGRGRRHCHGSLFAAPFYTPGETVDLVGLRQ